jgi:hypothetical protein
MLKPLQKPPIRIADTIASFKWVFFQVFFRSLLMKLPQFSNSTAALMQKVLCSKFKQKNHPEFAKALLDHKT